MENDVHAMYRSGTGILLYLIKHSRPDIGNPVRELTKVMDRASNAHVNELLRVITFVLDTDHMGLQFCPTMKDGIWRL